MVPQSEGSWALPAVSVGSGVVPGKWKESEQPVGATRCVTWTGQTSQRNEAGTVRGSEASFGTANSLATLSPLTKK
jgi:hypothetical protein